MTGNNKLMDPSSASESPPERSPDKLSLALEPESAAIYCHIMSKKQTSTTSNAACYLVVDIGGGTVDISAYRIATIGNRQHIEMVQPPSGNESGGSKVNRNFKNFLEVLVKDTGFSRYVNGPDEQQNAKHRAHLHQITNQTFEVQKVLYGNKSQSERGRVAVRLTHSFATFYAQELQNGASQDPDIQIVEQTLRLTKAKMEGFFEPLMKNICGAISESIQDLEGQLHGIYLVGGFGGSNYVYTVIEEEFGRAYKCIPPHDPHFAVINGAVLFGLNPNTVFARRADASYGVRSATEFIPGFHEDKYKQENDDGIIYCENIFVTYVERGDSVCTGEVFYHSFYPFWHSQRSLQIEIYSSPEKDVWYTTGKWGKGREAERPASVYKLGQLTVEMPVLRGDKNRPVDVQLDFSQTEIQVRAYDRTSQNERKVVVDFLSCIEDPDTSHTTDIK